jgi:hypothetical protein
MPSEQWWPLDVPLCAIEAGERIPAGQPKAGMRLSGLGFVFPRDVWVAWERRSSAFCDRLFQAAASGEFRDT